MKLTTKDNEVVSVAEDRSAYLYAGAIGVVLAGIVAGAFVFLFH